MRVEQIRKQLFRVRERLNDALILSNARHEDQTTDTGSATGAEQATATASDVCHAIEDTDRECRAVLDSVIALQREIPDADSVQQQLLDVVSVRVSRFTDAHPFGESVENDEAYDVELENALVEIPIETDSLPYWLDAQWADDGVEVELEFRLTRFDWHPPAVSVRCIPSTLSDHA